MAEPTISFRFFHCRQLSHMPREPKTEWGGSLHTTFRLLPTPLGHLKPFLESDGLTQEEILQKLPYDRSRSRGPAGAVPDAKRYRDCRQIYETAGLVYEEGGILHVTELGRATLRWLPLLSEKNVPLLGRHAAYALAACQLQNPIGVQPYDSKVRVFPFSFIWRAMLALEARISSDELNRALFKVTNEEQLGQAIEAIREARRLNDLDVMGAETLTGDKKNDRVIPWISIASFGWTLIAEKRTGDVEGYYTIRPRAKGILREAAAIRHRHRDFGSNKREYVEYIAEAACLPKDVR
mgnify:CR=1 FL=1|jgi:hypothetical protein